MRILDANYNRAKEGLRVCEDICRFILNDSPATRRFKNTRHRLTKILTAVGFKDLVLARQIESDVGKSSLKSELKRKDIADIFYANIQRVKESIRVLEELTKLLSAASSAFLKTLRYQIYALEKTVIKKF